MANRTWQHARTQGFEHIYLPLTLLGAGAAAPTLSEGDPNGSYYSISRVAAGSYVLTTKDAFIAIVYKAISPIAGYKAALGPATQNSTGTWSMPIFVIADSASVALGAATVTAGGTGYTSAPTITYNNAHGNVGLTGTVTIGGGAVTAVTITSGGFGTDTAPPTITLAGGGGSGATATVALVASGTSAVDLASGKSLRFIGVFRNSSVTP